MASALPLLLMNCTQLKNDSVLGMDGDSFSDRYTRQMGPGKRDQEGEDSDRCQVKKRRKQSKPIRIASTESAFPEGDGKTPNLNATTTATVTSTQQWINSKPPDSALFVNNYLMGDQYDPGDDKSFKNESDDGEGSTEENCTESFDEEVKRELIYPLNLSHAKSSPSPKDSVDSLPVSNPDEKSWYKNPELVSSLYPIHPFDPASLRSQVYQNSILTPSQNPGLFLPNFKRIFVANNENQISSSPHRIFNPEAFCDLCNKEFCNKYFLKTHKANKHGIYVESQGSTSIDNTLPSLPMINYFSNNLSNLPSLTSTTTTMSAAAAAVAVAAGATPTTTTTTPAAAAAAVAAAAAAAAIVPQLNKKPTTGFTTNSPKTNSSSMRAFCNICQREFCNKYFVRRHKAKIHGIVEHPEESSQDYKMIPPLSDKPGDDIAGPSSTLKLSLDLQQQQPMGQLSKENSSTVPMSTPNSSLQDIIMEESAKLIKKEEDNESDTSDNPPNSLHLLVSSWQNEESKESCKSPERNKKIISSANSNSNTAFCDICCKEYCNKYFLRVHKQKCHGIVMSDKDERSKDGMSSVWKSNQPMPLNLILRETHKTVPESESPFSCNLCEMTFSEQYLLKMHYSVVHAPKNQDTPPQSLLSNNSCYLTSETNLSKNNSETTVTPILNSFDQQTPVPHKNNILTNHQSDCLESNPIKTFNSDVHKLHTMIMKLNQQGQTESFICDICNKDYGRSTMLENHIIKDHAMLLEEISNGFYEDNLNSPFSGGNNKYEGPKSSTSYSSSTLMEQHMTDKHNPFYSKINLRNGEENQEPNSQMTVPGERPILHTPTSSFCEICKKELCNKYFMKTHMQRMHGISIENGAHIGGVVCDICNKELCSKYFLRVHKQNSHGIVEEAFLPQVGGDVKGQILNVDTALKPSENELTHRYFSHFTEVCTICSRRFRSVKWLKTHLLNDHGEEGKEKWRELQLQNGNKSLESSKYSMESKKSSDSFYSSPYRNSTATAASTVTPVNTTTVTTTAGPAMDTKPHNEPSTSFQTNETILSSMVNKSIPSKHYQCSYCNFSTPLLVLLYVHEKSHFPPSSTETQDFRCPICGAPHENQELLEQHITAHHHSISSTSSSNYSKEETANCYPQNSIYEQPGSLEANDKDNCSLAADDNNFTDVSEHSSPYIRPVGEASLRCAKCPFVSSHLETYVDHIRKDHKLEDNFNYFQIVRDALLQLSNVSSVPASYAVPTGVSKFIMQPFVMEDKGNNNTFPSSLVFLPVKERLNKPITASFRLTPT